MPEQRRLGKGGWEYGPAMQPAAHSFARDSVMMFMCVCVLCVGAVHIP